ncbi:STAS domain-containing protein [Rossellomorea aquimaris]|uniref:Fis family transcriptional regulator n=1 Tax=Rossellomorea aquimaris TaxID=189382 RepID=A0A1J6WET2_9BACI|nr:STAS domain-containing protein [Rossellomorea aquimaris]OIU70392.1 Fis family transcriptional regulator [Rossellomorea aquimaris]
MTAYEVNVNGSIFDWNLENGDFHFENDEVVLFWVNTAFKTLFDSIEEIAGEKESELVLETAGYRTGKIVSQFYMDTIGHTDEILTNLPNTYAAAGWGLTDVVYYSIEDRKAVVTVKNGWEHKVILAQGKADEGKFLPGHWAGVFSGLFNANVWYRIVKSQIGGDEYSQYEFFPSDITPTLNVKTLFDEQTKKARSELEQLTEQRTQVLSDIIKEISSPIIPVMDSILVVPLVGPYDELRGEELLNRTLLNLPHYNAQYLVLDLTSLTGFDDYTLDFIRKFVGSAGLLGTKCLLVGISAELSMKIVQSGHSVAGIPCFTILQQGIKYALDQQGLEITHKRS